MSLGLEGVPWRTLPGMCCRIESYGFTGHNMAALTANEATLEWSRLEPLLQIHEGYAQNSLSNS